MRIVRHLGWLVVCAAACGGDSDPVVVDAAVGSDGATTGDGGFVCAVEAPTSCTDPDLRYSDVEPIIEEHCQVCHSGETEQWPLTSYSHVADWFDLIPPEVVNCRMPPPESAPSITDEERLVILTWFRCGFPE